MSKLMWYYDSLSDEQKAGIKSVPMGTWQVTLSPIPEHTSRAGEEILFDKCDVAE